MLGEIKHIFGPVTFGPQIITDIHLTIPKESIVKVKLKGRGISAYRKMTFQVPDPNFYELPNGSLVCHPRTLDRLQIEIANSWQENLDLLALKLWKGNEGIENDRS